MTNMELYSRYERTLKIAGLDEDSLREHNNADSDMERLMRYFQPSHYALSGEKFKSACHILHSIHVEGPCILRRIPLTKQ